MFPRKRCHFLSMLELLGLLTCVVDAGTSSGDWRTHMVSVCVVVDKRTCKSVFISLSHTEKQIIKWLNFTNRFVCLYLLLHDGNYSAQLFTKEICGWSNGTTPENTFTQKAPSFAFPFFSKQIYRHDDDRRSCTPLPHWHSVFKKKLKIDPITFKLYYIYNM